MLRDNITDARVVVISCAAYRSMCDALFEQFQSGAAVILYRMGEGYARKTFGAFSKIGLGRDDILQGLERLSYMAGWGKMRFHLVDEHNAECVVEKSAFLLRREDIGSNTCYFLSGVLAASASELFKRKFKAQEVMCESSGANLCKFKLSVE